MDADLQKRADEVADQIWRALHQGEGVLTTIADALAAAEAAGRNRPKWMILAEYSIEDSTDFYILAIKHHRRENGSSLQDAKAAVDHIRQLAGKGGE